MSWDSYVDNLIAQSADASGEKHVDKAAIIGLQGGAAWRMILDDLKLFGFYMDEED